MPNAEGELGDEAGAEGANGLTNGDVRMNGDGAEHEMNGDASAAPNGDTGSSQPLPLQGERQPNKERITTPYLTKYERARVLGTRALQIRCVLCC